MLRNVAIAAVLSSGCSMFMHTVEKPKVDVRDVAVTSISLGGTIDGEMRLDVTNPNAVGVPLSGIDWQLSIGGAPSVSGHVDVSQTIPARGVAPVVAAVRLNAQDGLGAVQKVMNGARDYQLDARLHFSTALGEISVDVHKDGALSSETLGAWR
ncbi:MAG TPA: LEA type 2 family protein [Kofleriaceae bacterium]|jgi:LEA14-like dessication related protein|nr:LEA type 2 family protein [Kofleriaceae bacterium]